MDGLPARRGLARAAAAVAGVLALAGPAAAGPGLPGAPGPAAEGDAPNFPARPVGTRSEARPVRVVNHGVLPVKMGEAHIDGTGREAYSAVTDCPGSVLAPGGACSTLVTFAPVHPGAGTAVLRFSHDGPAGEVAV